jgi:hypothetical protein
MHHNNLLIPKISDDPLCRLCYWETYFQVLWDCEPLGDIRYRMVNPSKPSVMEGGPTSQIVELPCHLFPGALL